MTSHRAVLADGSVKDKFVLVTGGAGAVGNYAIQWAKWAGAKVITTISNEAKAQVARSAGADYIINYKNENVIDRIREITGRERGIDRIIDVDFTNNLGVADSVLRTNGSIALYSANPDDLPLLPILSLMLRNITIRTILVYTMPAEAKQQALKDITTALQQGALRHNIAQTFSLSEVAQAHDLQDSGQAIGKIIIEIA